MTINNLIYLQREQLALFLIKKAVNILTILYLIFNRIFIKGNKHSNREGKGTKVFIALNKKDIYIAACSMLSLDYYIGGLDFRIINDGTLNSVSKFILNLTGVKLSIVSEKQENTALRQLDSTNWLKSFYYYGWSGKKLVLPLLLAKKRKIIQIDSDTLFFKKPQEIIDFVNDKKQSNLFAKDCARYSITSELETKYILGNKPKLSYLNSGLLCINVSNFMNNVGFNKLEKWIPKIIFQANDRLTSVYPQKDKFAAVFPLLEQTLHWYSFENLENVKMFDSEKYYIFANHSINYKSLPGSLKFVHFSGESNKKSMYRYLFFSIIQKSLDTFFGGLKNDKPWFIYSDNYCPRCWHDVKLRA